MFVFALSVLSMGATDITLIVTVFKEGKASGSAGNMAAEVDIAVPGASAKGTGPEAETILARFFESNRPTGFTVLHHADKNDNGFVVGRLTTGNGEFRVNVTYSVKEGKVFIQAIRVE
jgi:hypothetical protein